MRKNDLSQFRLNVTFSVRYKMKGKWHILQPGQVIPVWSAKYWTRVWEDVEIVSMVVSTDPAGHFVHQPGLPGVSVDKFLLAKRSTNPDVDEMRVLQAAKANPLGGYSCIQVMRPSRMPLGFGLFQQSISSNDLRPQWERRDLTMAQAIEPMLKFRRQSEARCPYPVLYSADEQGACKARNLADEGKVVSLRETLLPVAPVPFDEHGDTLEPMDYAVHAERHLNQIGANFIYLGFGIYPGLNLTSSVPDKMIDLDTHKGAYARDSVLYSIPHGTPVDYAAQLKAESRTRMTALLSGQNELEEYSIPVPEFIKDMPVENTQAVPGWGTDDILQGAGLS